MAQDALSRLISALDTDAALRAKIQMARTPAEAAKIAAESGFPVTVDEIMRLAEPAKASSEAEMSDAELAGASGGVIGLSTPLNLKGIGIRPPTPSQPGLGGILAGDCNITSCSGLSGLG